jgi:hypothetical protein
MMSLLVMTLVKGTEFGVVELPQIEGGSGKKVVESKAFS